MQKMSFATPSTGFSFAKPGSFVSNQNSMTNNAGTTQSTFSQGFSTQPNSFASMNPSSVPLSSNLNPVSLNQNASTGFQNLQSPFVLSNNKSESQTNQTLSSSFIPSLNQQPSLLTNYNIDPSISLDTSYKNLPVEAQGIVDDIYLNFKKPVLDSLNGMNNSTNSETTKLDDIHSHLQKLSLSVMRLMHRLEAISTETASLHD